MRYDSDTGKIKITLKEFVTIARRALSPTLPCDENEPTLLDAPRRILKVALGEINPETLTLGFDTAGHSFELIAPADDISENTVTVAREISSSPKKPRREEAAEARGEAFVLAYALAILRGYEKIKIRLLYVNLVSGESELLEETAELKKLSSFFSKCLATVSKYAHPEIERVTKRLPTLKAMKFPYDNIRKGQSELVRAGYRTLSRGGVLYASAPTGTGKTVSALYPALRTLGDGRCDKVFYLTPKSTTAEALSDCINLMVSRGAVIRAIILTAKDKACLNRRACSKSKAGCKLAKCNSLPDATLELYGMQKAVVTLNDARDVSQKYEVCPYELMLAYAELCDVVCTDFNHLFDPHAYIRRFFSEGGKYALLIDEAHNLPERAREIYSDEISVEYLNEAAENSLFGEHSPLPLSLKEAARVFYDVIFEYLRAELRENHDGKMLGAVNLSTVPDRLYTLFDELSLMLEGELFRAFSARDDEAELRLSAIKAVYYKIKRFCDTLARFDECYKLFAFYENGAIRVKLYCLDPSSEIRQRINKCHGAMMFSATLSPIDYYRSVLGGERSDDMLEVPSPFDTSQLSVIIADKVSTRFSERDDTLSAVCRVIAATVSSKRGHYMIFSPSFKYSEALARTFAAKYPKIKCISQTPDMSRVEKEEFLQHFKGEAGSYLVAFCVMGGIYSEGIDLAGDSLIGAVIVGVGIPALSYEREALAEYYDEKYEMGKQYSYIYPGMNRVFQAAGRVIRREDDRGVIVLIDDRFDDPIYKKSLPALWRGVKFVGDAKRIRELLDEFWQGPRD
ncbi:MAG: ATP-dependent DNA helicase [Clostridia bacterium]|nr:ATP-dependent DNA helicase [Clostridia bacterium]